MGQSQDRKPVTGGTTRAAATTWAGGTGAVRCTCCGEPLADGAVVTALLRGVVYEYCDGDCRDRHADAVLLQGGRCELCDADAAGDTGRCAEHLDDEAESGSYPLAS